MQENYTWFAFANSILKCKLSGNLSGAKGLRWSSRKNQTFVWWLNLKSDFLSHPPKNFVLSVPSKWMSLQMLKKAHIIVWPVLFTLLIYSILPSMNIPRNWGSLERLMNIPRNWGSLERSMNIPRNWGSLERFTILSFLPGVVHHSKPANITNILMNLSSANDTNDT